MDSNIFPIRVSLKNVGKGSSVIMVCVPMGPRGANQINECRRK